MNLSSLIRCDKEFLHYIKTVRDAVRAEKHLPIAVNGLAGGARDAFLIESIKEALLCSERPVLVLVPSENECEMLADMLSVENFAVRVFKKRDLIFYNIRSSHDVERERLSVLSEVLEGKLDCIVATPDALISPCLPPEELEKLTQYLRVGDIISPSELKEKLIDLGFSSTDSSPDKGQFSSRGDILDFWIDESPYRVEFFGDEIDRISIYSPITLRTESVPDEIKILPVKEVLISRDVREKIIAELDYLIEKQKDATLKERLIRERGVALSGGSIDFADRFLGIIYESQKTLLNYLEKKSLITFILGSNECREAEERARKNTSKLIEENLNSGLISKKCAFYILDEKTAKTLQNDNLSIHLNAFSGGVSGELSGLFGFRTRRTVAYGDNPSMLLEDLRGYKKSYYRVVIGCENEVAKNALTESLYSEGFAVAPLPENDDFDLSRTDGSLIYLTVSSHAGFDLVTPKIALISMKKDKGREVMRHRKRERMIRRLGGSGERLMSYADLSVGDYIVHANYGIGLFLGIETVNALGVKKDYITIQYAGEDRLFVPCDRLEMIGKYIGERERDGSVKLSKMGGTEWNKTKSKAKAAAKDIAKKLIELYARRQRSTGFAYSEDSDLELSFADAFEFMETDSQLKAIEEIKGDMMKSCPMNRLLCGDVGFGKTEVALRAAFKAIMSGKQVAILVPTTILALQHFQTAISRFRGYPVTVEMLTRFKKPKEQAEILRKVKRGETDILIGTHKLLFGKVEFRDLGLLIVDEEQRFGVAQKEKLKEKFTSVDVLTLTATPIPRTLNMAMNGISDISILDEAPEERRPVQTYVLEHDNSIIYDAIRRELSRGGQVLYLYNKIDTIEFVSDKIQTEIPDARVTFAHGRMDKDELEYVWELLVRGELDVLVCTTIIETGVDLPNANTLIIEDADRFGLAQLHQIRGRVGRSERQAYAYLTYHPGKALSEVAEKRLTAIKEFAEFGAGFKIALRDLEIRGAGNLLGAEQHGYIDAVGYDLYCKILNEAVIEERGEAVTKKEETLVDMKLSAHIPLTYIPSESDRMEIYKKISLIRAPDDKSDLEDELCDRFGDIPLVVERLLYVATSRAMGEEIGIKKINIGEGTVSVVTGAPNLEIWSEVFPKFKGIGYSTENGGSIVCRTNKAEPAKLAYEIVESAYRVTKNIEKSQENK